MLNFFSRLFRSDFMPHGHCYFWRPELVWLHAISDGIITLSYYFIPAALLYFIRKRKDVPFHWMFVMFGIFILGCGTTHFMEIWTLWYGTYRLAGVLKAVTAIASAATAFAFIPLMPRVMALPSPSQLRQANEILALKSEQLRALSADHVTKLEAERQHISREVHDEAGQALVAIKLGLQGLALRIPPDRPELSRELDELRETVTRSVAQLRNLGQTLRPPTLDELGLGKAIEQLGFEHRKRTQMTVNLDIEPSLPRLPAPAEISIYRIAQEGLTNVIRHSQATTVWIHLGLTDGGLEFSLRDDGCGFVSGGVHRGFGLLGMQERAAMTDVRLEIFTKRGDGTSIIVLAPWHLI